MKFPPLRILPALALSALPACTPLSVAGLALDLVQPGAGAGMFRNPYDQPPGDGLQEALGRIKQQPDPRCLDALDGQREAAKDRAEPVTPTAAAPSPDADASAARPGVRLVCLPGNPEPIALVLRPTPRAPGVSPTTLHAAHDE